MDMTGLYISLGSYRAESLFWIKLKHRSKKSRSLLAQHCNEIGYKLQPYPQF